MAEIPAKEMLVKQKYGTSNKLTKMFLYESQNHPSGQ